MVKILRKALNDIINAANNNEELLNYSDIIRQLIKKIYKIDEYGQFSLEEELAILRVLIEEHVDNLSINSIKEVNKLLYLVEKLITRENHC
ncbi:MAG: hypothetical protein ACFFG0_08190 [Candidatus Thorarchaeota archaeon]